jgi:hypothetical protein
MSRLENLARISFVLIALLGFGRPISAQVISCSSDDGRRHLCAADIQGQVRMVKQNSDSVCREGYSWGFDRGGIWVDRGCRADFEVMPYAYVGSGPGNVISCSSDDGNRHYCPTNGPGRVQLLKQRSDSSCQEGYSWGSDSRGVWVDRGCRGDFAVVAYADSGTSPSNLISCSSDDGNRHYCPTNGAGQVQLIKQRSDSICQEGQSWGSDDRGIWVDRGCRADFALIPYGYRGSEPTSNISCSSDDGNRHYCPTNGRVRVQLVKQKSDSTCQQGYSWGSDDRGIWVDHGCRADFGVDSYTFGGADQGRTLSCSSDDGHRHFCPADTRGGVLLLKQRSKSSCEQGHSWGFKRDRIWVDHGCRADFLIAH